MTFGRSRSRGDPRAGSRRVARRATAQGGRERERERERGELIARDHDNSVEEEDERGERQDARGRRRSRGRRPSRRSAERAQFRQHRATEQSLSGEA